LSDEDPVGAGSILDLARKVGRKAPANFTAQVDNWMNDRREKKSSVTAQGGDDQTAVSVNNT
jgi:hypothetical protein